MLRGYRGIILAALIGLGLAVLATVAYYRVQDAQIDPYPDAAYQPARNASLPPPGKDRQVVPPAYDPHCERPQTQADSDLCAQWSAVEAVKEANRVTRIATRAGAFEFGALIVSLFFTGWAALAASKAAGAADNAVRVTENTAKQQLRPYVSVKPISVTGNDPKTVNIIIKNEGQTPAYGVAYRVHLRFDRDGLGREEIDDIFRALPDAGDNEIIIGGGDENKLPLVARSLSDADWVKCREGLCVAYVGGHITYTDIFGEKHETWFLHHFEGDEFVPSVYPLGNRAT